MKLKINKACDLNSISVFPPQSRRLSAIPTGLQSSQLRSQQSQQSFSQGISSQHGMFSQLSQTSYDEALTNDQRFNSQERENSVKKTSCFPQISYACEESQMPISRSSTNLMHKWNPASVPDCKCQINDELKRRIGLIETSLSKFEMILGSVQSEVMQVNKGTKEVSLEMEGIRQKLIALDSSLQLMIKGQEDTKSSIGGSLKSISERLSNETYQDKLQQIFLVLSALPEQMEVSLLKLQNDLGMSLSKEMQAVACSWKACNQISPSVMMLVPKVTGGHSTPQRKLKPVKNPVMPPKASGQGRQAAAFSKVEIGAWNTVKAEEVTSTHRMFHKERKGVSSVQKEKHCSVIIESDEEINGDFSCLIEEKETGKGIGNYTIDEAVEESELILRKARRRKRKLCNPIIIN